MSYSQYSGNPYQQGPSQESGYGYGNPYGQQVSFSVRSLAPETSIRPSSWAWMPLGG